MMTSSSNSPPNHLRGRTPWSRTLAPLALLLVALLLPACGEDAVAPEPVEPVTTTELAAVVNSVDLSLTVFPVDSPSTSETVGLGPDGSPVGLSIRNGRAAVPMGTVPAVALVDLRTGSRERTISLPEGSGATGSAFVDDSTVVVANPGRNSVSVVNVSSGDADREIEVGTFPQNVVPAADRIFVLNSELGADFQPARPGTVTVLDGGDYSVVATIQLSGRNPGGGAVGPDGRLYVVNSGSFGAGNGSLSVVDPGSLEEVAHHEGFGDFPGAPVFGPEGNLFVTSFSYGIAVWNPRTGSFERGPDDAIAPGGVGSVSGVGFDSGGRLYALQPECQDPALVHRLDPATYEPELEIQVGTCPMEVGFSEIRE